MQEPTRPGCGKPKLVERYATTSSTDCRGMGRHASKGTKQHETVRVIAAWINGNSREKAGLTGMAERLAAPTKPGNSRWREKPQSKNARRQRGRGIGDEPNNSPKCQKLQTALHDKRRIAQLRSMF